uniref:Vang-like protein n=1 Tax=Caenorhabditis japonica TaxID=281687 RepID=A0A8R1HSE7_CAEJA
MTFGTVMDSSDSEQNRKCCNIRLEMSYPDGRKLPKDTRSCVGGFRYEGHKKQLRPRYAQSDIGEPFIPKFSAIASEGQKLPPPTDDWADNTTVLTGMTTDSFTMDEKMIYTAPIGRVVGRRCSRLVWLLASSLLCVISVVSAPIMCSLPIIAPHFGFSMPAIQCDVDCEGLLFLMAVKTVFLVIAIGVLYWRKAMADMPRLYFVRAALTFLVMFILFAFWLFYVVRIMFERYDNYKYIVSYSTSLLDALLWTHYLSVVLLELRRLRAQFIVTIVRDPDGEMHTLNIGAGSIQEAATEILRFYTTRFSSFNIHLDNARQSAVAKQSGMQGATAGFKMYNIEQFGGQETVSEVNTRALMEAAARRRIGGYTEVMQEELDFEKRLKKRKYRLIAAAEDAFSHVQNTAEGGQKTVINNQMDSLTAAQNVFTWIVRPLTKFLKTTRLQSRHPSGEVTRHIERCLTLKLSHRTFLQRFFSDRIPQQEVVTESKWSVICEDTVSSGVQNGSYFVLKSHNSDIDCGVQLVCSVSSIPFFNLTEQAKSSNEKFALKISNESAV